MSFNEFLLANNEQKLLNYLNTYQLDQQMPEGFHLRLIRLFKTYLITGGMPESISTFLEYKNYETVDKIKTNLINTYTNDFSKYGNKLDILQVLTVFKSLPKIVGNKVKYVNISRDYRASDLARVLHMFELARICYRVCHSSSFGIPVDASVNRKAIYTHFAKQQKTSLEVVEKVQARRKAEKADPGEFYQNPDGMWVRK